MPCVEIPAGPNLLQCGQMLIGILGVVGLRDFQEHPLIDEGA